MKNNKILFITNCYLPNEIGGAEKTARSIVNYLSKNNDVLIYTLHTSYCESNKYDSNVITSGIFNVGDPWRDPNFSTIKKIIFKVVDLFNIFHFIKIFKIIKKHNITDCFTHNLLGISTSVWLACKLNRVDVVHFFHDYYLICNNCGLVKNNIMCNTPCQECRFLSFKNRIMSRCVKKFVGVSEFIRDIHEQRLGLVKNKPILIYNKPRLKKSQSLRVLQSEYIKIGYIGRIEPVKGLEVIFKALNELDNSKYKLIIAGRVADNKYYDFLKGKYNNVKLEYLGFIEPELFYERIDISIVPSLWPDPYPAVAYEPSMFNIPVIGSRIGGITEIIEKNDIGFTFNVNDYIMLSKLIIKLSDPIFYNRFSEKISLLNLNRDMSEYDKLIYR